MPLCCIKTAKNTVRTIRGRNSDSIQYGPSIFCIGGVSKMSNCRNRINSYTYDIVYIYCSLCCRVICYVHCLNIASALIQEVVIFRALLVVVLVVVAISSNDSILPAGTIKGFLPSPVSSGSTSWKILFLDYFSLCCNVHTYSADDRNWNWKRSGRWDCVPNR